MKFSRAGIVATLVGFVVLVGWMRYGYLVRGGVERELGLRAAHQDAQIFRLADLTDFAWDRVVFLGPYQNQAKANNALGFEWKDFSKYGLEMSESFGLVVFAQAGQVVHVEEIGRCKPDFVNELEGVAVSREQAVFRIVPRNDCTVLEPISPALSNSGSH
jgi:hypothetical protein